jgi:tetratricopeptide (TPR) repeat protein
MKASQGVAVAFAVMCAGSAFAREPKIGKFVEYQAGNFTIATSLGEAQVRDLMDDLALFQLTLETTLHRKSVDTGIPTHIMLLGHREWEKYLMPRQELAGLFVPRSFANYLFIDGSTDHLQALRIVFHEYTHFFLSSQLAGEYPPWFNEGMAELFSMSTFGKGQAEFGIPVGRVLDVRSSEWIPFDRLLAVNSRAPEYITHTLARGFYGQAWLTVQYGMVEDRAFGAQMFSYINALNRLVPQDEAIRNSFGTDLAAIDKKLFAYSRRSSLNAVGIKIGNVPPLTLSAGRVVAETEALAMFADLMMIVGIEPARVRLFVDAVAETEPATPRTLLLQARLAEQGDDDAAFESALAGIAPLLDPSDWQTRKSLALILLDRAEESRPGRASTEQRKKDAERALQWFDEALAHNPEDVESLWGYGTAAAALDQHLELAATRLQLAYRKAPTTADIAASLAHIYNDEGDLQRMLPLLQDVIRFSRNISTRQWAVEMYERVSEALSRKQRNDAERAAAQAQLDSEVAKTRSSQRKKPAKP